MKQSKELLEEIASYTHCDYLSDLHLRNYFQEIVEAIEKIDIDGYSLNEWNSTVQYITQQKVEFNSRNQAKVFLQDYLNRIN